MSEASTPGPDAIRIPEQVIGIVRRLEEAGYETWCVGGAIRDALLGGAGSDVDLATAAPPTVVRSLFRRTIAVGIEHGTVGVLDEQGILHEVTTFRHDVVTDGRHAVVAFGASLEEDLARRDFTINAIAYHPVHDRWADPFDGRADLQRRVVRAVGDPVQRFREDRLRILRALRFAARLDFTIDPATWEAAVAQSGDIAHLSAERVRDEWVKGLRTARDPASLLRLWLSSGAAASWVPELDAARVAQPAPTSDDRDPPLLTAYYCAPSASVWRRLKGSTAEIRRAAAIDAGPPAPAAADGESVRRWMHRVGDAVSDLVRLAQWGGEVADGWDDEVAATTLRGDPTTRGQLAITGNDLIAAGIVNPGPALGLLLDQLLDAVLTDPARNSREQLLARARDLAHELDR
ncbi:MAG: CCA tRNA nucleotidyltransferase [Gemmatimonadales bacterium]|nr:CCA tRNA nucleotidyltransferase [Gemmatimonadota bacterium]MBP6443799.1 CCA tRNA nucleotidyltransferase [Gemmatimonadales bacterium]